MGEDQDKLPPLEGWQSQIAELRRRANWEYIANERHDLRKSWHTLIGHFAAPDVAGDVDSSPASHWYKTLESAYQSRGRHYHNLDHSRQMLSWIAYSWNDTWETCLIAKYAAWFHDAVYDSTRSDNEERSAELAVDAASQLQVPASIAEPAATWILCTKGHQAADSPACAHFLDCDLAILGGPEELYRQYAAAIRAEYAWVAEDAYRHGRSKLLAHFLSRDRIYAVDQMAGKLEVQARWNLQKEIRLLAV